MHSTGTGPHFKRITRPTSMVAEWPALENQYRSLFFCTSPVSCLIHPMQFLNIPLHQEWMWLPFQRLSALQMHARNSWAPLLRQLFDLLLKADMPLFFQYMSLPIEDAKRSRTFGYHNAVVSVSWTFPSPKLTSLPIKDVPVAYGAHLAWLKPKRLLWACSSFPLWSYFMENMLL